MPSIGEHPFFINWTVLLISPGTCSSGRRISSPLSGGGGFLPDSSAVWNCPGICVHVRGGGHSGWAGKSGGRLSGGKKKIPGSMEPATGDPGVRSPDVRFKLVREKENATMKKSLPPFFPCVITVYSGGVFYVPLPFVVPFPPEIPGKSPPYPFPCVNGPFGCWTKKCLLLKKRSFC